MFKNLIQLFGKGFINSYSQLFFADSKTFAWLLLISSFVTPSMGISGALSTLSGLTFAYWIGLNRTYIGYGTYSYNALMIGLVLGAQYQITLPYIVLLLVSSVLSVMIAVWFNSILSKYKLPALSLSFLFTLWLITIGLRTYANITLSETGIYRYNDWYSIGGEALVNFMNSTEESLSPEVIDVYLKSLSAVFFQYNIIAGFIILVGLIIWSRIAFVLSIIGFSIGYIFYFSLSGEFSQLYYSYIGFNFILTAIALGGFYLIPSRASFVLAIIAMPIIGVLISGLTGVLSVYQLPLYSLPFVITVLLILMLLHQRTYLHRLIPVSYQHFSPEKNKYNYANQEARFKNSKWMNIQLPFFGEWFVSQGYQGNITHKENWKEALDFVVVDETKHTFKGLGKSVTDFYCYSLPVLAPADGYVAEIADGISENEIGDIDLKENWGNTVVIKHADGLYSKLSHLKPHTILVQLNEFVKTGQVIGYCGNSGRSPEPHLHFQMQTTPYIGSTTINYPLAHFISRANETYRFHENEIPQEGSQIHHPIKTPLLHKAFHFLPGQVLTFEAKTENGNTTKMEIECMADAWNQTYLYCHKTKACAYFVNNGTTFYFTSYTGSKNTILFDIFCSCYKILLGYYPQLSVQDTMDISLFNTSVSLWMQDVLAPFFMYKKVRYQMDFTIIDDMVSPNYIELESRVELKHFNSVSKLKNYKVIIENNQLKQIIINPNSKHQQVITCIG